MIVSSENPNPSVLPSLGIHKSTDGSMTFVRASFPNVPEFACDSWCYENDQLIYKSTKPLSGGRLEMRHTWKGHPQELVTIITPEPGKVEFYAYLDGEGANTVPISQYPGPNLCWQLKPAPDFASAPQPYPEFVKRCFMFTENGRVFLDKTNRALIPCRKPDEDVNTPPWVQMYVGTWQQIPKSNPTDWAGFSTDRYTMSVMGVVSRDGKYLTALGNDSAGTMCQAWHDCEHNNPPWIQMPGGSRGFWRVKIYAMENDPDALIEAVRRDFGSLPRQADYPVPAAPAPG